MLRLNSFSEFNLAVEMLSVSVADTILLHEDYPRVQSLHQINGPPRDLKARQDLLWQEMLQRKMEQSCSVE